MRGLTAPSRRNPRSRHVTPALSGAILIGMKGVCPMRLRFWQRRSLRQRALDAIAAERRHPWVKPAAPATPGSANDEYWAVQAGLAGYGQP